MQEKFVDKIEEYYADVHRRITANTNNGYALHHGLQTGSAEAYRAKDALANMADYISTAMDIDSGQLILDAGCGVGDVALRIAAEHPDITVVASNVSHTQLHYGNEMKKRSDRSVDNVHFCKADYERNPFLNAIFDRILFMESLGHAENVSTVISETARVLKPEGKVVIFDHFVIESTDVRIPEFKNIWLAPGMVTVHLVEEALRGNFGDIKVTDLSDQVMASMKHLATNRLVTLSAEDMTQGAEILYSLMSEGKMGYFLVTASF